MWATGASRRPRWTPRLFNGRLAYPNFQPLKEQRWWKWSFDMWPTRDGGKGHRVIGNLSREILKSLEQTKCFWNCPTQLSRLNVLQQFGSIIIVSAAFVTIIGKSLTLGSLNKSVCVNISNIFARPLGSCWHHCIGACQGNNFTAFRNSDPRVGHVRIGPLSSEAGAKRGITW